MSEMRLYGRETIEAYVSDGDFICLKQDNNPMEEPSIIAMLPGDIPQIVSWLQQLAREVEARRETGQRSLPTDS